jgi:hypothetical protein
MSEVFKSRRHRITIQRSAADSFTTWAEICGDSVTIRFAADLWPGMGAVIGRQRFEIVGVIDRLGRTRLVELKLEARNSGAGEIAPRAMAMNSKAKGFRQRNVNSSVEENHGT